MILCCRHGTTMDMVSPTASFVQKRVDEGQFSSMEFAKQTKCRHTHASCEGLWNTYDADLSSSPPCHSFNFTEMQLEADSGGVIKEQSDRLRGPLATAP